MILKQLRLSGFKSFVEPATLHIEPGLTGVVGPNGCGKSNLLEAIRWVMGENSPKSMRGGGMDDVIFAGTAGRPSRDSAEVVLSGELEGREIEVVRRIERGAGSAYRLNGDDVRAKDIALLFADAATGAHSPALVSQGKIAQVIAARPTERRQMLEEAAGIAGLHVRRRDAEAKLRQTEANLARLEDLMAGLDSRIATLKRQARQAERYRALSGRIELFEARLLFAGWREAAAAADAAKVAASEADTLVETNRDEADVAQREQRAAAQALAMAREEMADRRDDANAHAHRMASLKGKLEAVEQRLADLDRQADRIEKDRADADLLTSNAATALSDLATSLDEAQQRLAEDEERHDGLVAALREREEAARTAELALARATADHAGLEAEWRVNEAECRAAQDTLDRISGEAEHRASLRKSLLEQRTAIDCETAQERSSAAEADADALEAMLEAARRDKTDAQTARDATSAASAEASAELAGIEREHAALSRERTAREKAAGDGARKAADMVQAEPGYERALAAVLGRDGRALVGSPDGDSESDGRFWTGADAGEPVADALLSHVSRFPDELRARLSATRVVEEDLGQALPPGEWLVTRAGQCRRWDGLVTRGDGAAQAARFEADNRLAALEARLPDLRETAQRAKAEAVRAAKRLQARQGDIVRLERDRLAALNLVREARRTLDKAQDDAARIDERLEELALLAEEDHRRLKDAEHALEAVRTARGGLADPANARLALEAKRTANAAARERVQNAAANLAALEQALAVGRERTTALMRDHANWEARSSEATHRLSDMGKRFEEITAERAIAAARPAGIEAQLAEGSERHAELTDDLRTAERTLADAQQAADAADGKLDRARDMLADAREVRATRLARAEAENQRRAVQARQAGERFGCPPSHLPERFDFAVHDLGDVEAEQGERDRLLASRERIGPVNLVAADELGQIEAEHAGTTAEQKEMEEAVARLRGSIGRLNREGRDRLRAAFEQVNEHFQRLFGQLFDAGGGGGQAYLALIDSDDPLEAGLEIFAQPPGKRLQSLTLLSGGEQALTAIALIFALFLTNPAPICVLDEVDAPLDDANIDRFCDLLEWMTRQTSTRYLIVTHNAVTMSRMDRLFGVTMIEPGVSRLVSVDLGMAEDLLAAE